MKTKLGVMFAMLVAAVAVLAVACGSSGTGVTVEKGLAAAVGQDIGGGSGAPASMAASEAETGGAADASAVMPAAAPLAEAKLGAPAAMSRVAGMGGEMMAPATGGVMAPFAQGAVAGLTVQGFGRASKVADTARVQFVVSKGYGIYPEPLPGEEPKPMPEGGVESETAPAITPEIYPTPTPLTEEDLAPLLDAIRAQGVSDADIEVTIYPGGGYYGYYGPEDTARVTVTLRDMDKVGPVVDAGTAAVNESGTLYLQNVGVTYRVDDCDALLKEARRAAVEDGRDNGDAFAEALGVSRGDLVAASEYSYDPMGYGGCTQDSYYYGPYEYEGPPYDPAAPAEVQIVSSVSLTFAIE